MIDDKGLRQTAPSVLESREHLEAILQGVADGVIVQDAEGVIAYANEAAAQLLGVPSILSLLHHSIADVFAPFDLFDTTGSPLSTANLPAQAVFQGDSSARRTIILRHRESSDERWWIVTASPVRDAADRVHHVVCILRDATDRVRGAQANARLAAIVASSGDAILGKNLNGIITSWNPAAERLYGYLASESIGQSVAILIPPDRPDELQSIMDRLRSGAQLDGFETVRVCKDGSRVDVALTISPILGADGRITGASTIARDITEQRRAQDGLRLLAEAGEVLGTSLEYQTTLASVAQLIVPRLADWCAVNMVDEAGKPTQLALTHVDPDKVVWLRMLQEQFPPDPDEAIAQMQAFSNGEPLIFREITDEFLVANARSPEHLEAIRQIGFRSAVAVPMMARGRVVGTISLVFAESGRLYDVADIALAQEIAQRAALAVDNASLYDEAQQAARAREDFLLTASHELRTPLTSVKAAAQLASRYLNQPEPDREKMATMIARLQDEIGRLETLSLDLLDAARIQRGRFELQPEPCDLIAIIDDVLAAIEHDGYRQPTHRLIVDADTPVSGVWDPQRLRQVVSNLVSNALKYSPAGGEVCIRILRDDGDAVLVVED
ncbi:MAG: PAS domain S-box protein, partial [Chloroflexota bacterium]|nr:PAS domain S-box protein [Chloroflexota bacterium]